jgi:hypothetical protein
LKQCEGMRTGSNLHHCRFTRNVHFKTAESVGQPNRRGYL